MKNQSIKFLVISFFLICGLNLHASVTNIASESDDFVRVEGSQFLIGNEPYRYIGTNFWYGSILGSKGEGGNRERLKRELDTLKSLGIDNLRILVGGDGDKGLASHIEPTLQTAPGVYDEDLLEGLDFLLIELEKRNMKAVLYLNNSWEWSGGFSTYLEWAGAGKALIPSISGYPEFYEYVSQFLVNEKAKTMFADHVRKIVGRTNSINGNKYSDSPAIMAWQIANEPRAFTKNNFEPFTQWIHETAKLIKSIDSNHLVSTGSEGLWGCEDSLDVWKQINSFPEIDYATIHIWPYNWGWANSPNVESYLDSAKYHTDEYITQHYDALMSLKPLVLEEFGYPRDEMGIAIGSPTEGRDAYYSFIVDEFTENGRLAGINFWGWGGEAKPNHRTWQPGDDYTGDPAQEDQGLNSVYGSDSSTINILKKGIEKLRIINKR